MNGSNDAQELSTELDQEAERNRRFLADLEEKIRIVEKHYAQILIAEKKAYLLMLKQSIQKKIAASQ